MGNFNLQKYFKDQYLEESYKMDKTSNYETIQEEKIDLDTLGKIHKHLITVLTPLAKDSNLRMSHFESEYPTLSSFYNDLKNKNII
jgi:hypothetical protein